MREALAVSVVFAVFAVPESSPLRSLRPQRLDLRLSSVFPTTTYCGSSGCVKFRTPGRLWITLRTHRRPSIRPDKNRDEKRKNGPLPERNRKVADKTAQNGLAYLNILGSDPLWRYRKRGFALRKGVKKDTFRARRTTTCGLKLWTTSGRRRGEASCAGYPQ